MSGKARTGAERGAATRVRGLAGILMGLLAILLIHSVHAAEAAQGPSLTIDLGEGGTKQTAVVLQILALLTVLSLAPAVFIMVTSFTRMVIVLSFLRQAMGTQQVPPNQVLVSLALFLTMFVMAPVGQAVYKDAIQLLIAEQIGYEEVLNRGIQPIFVGFMLKQMRTRILSCSWNWRMPKPASVDQVLTHVVIPAFVLSELRIAFQIGFIYILFLIVDMVVASVLMSMGMMLLPPVVISLLSADSVRAG
ncbi:MAG: flagellar type III secretion system pore protein FliP [Nitrospiraceae bacterium]